MKTSFPSFFLAFKEERKEKKRRIFRNLPFFSSTVEGLP